MNPGTHAACLVLLAAVTGWPPAAVHAQPQDLAHAPSAPEAYAAQQPEPDKAPARPRPWRPFEASASMRAFPALDTGLLGLQIGYAFGRDAPLHLALTAEALWGRSQLASSSGQLGRMQLYWLVAGGGLSWRSASDPEFELGPRVLAGYGLARAEAARPQVKADDAGGFVLTVLLSMSARASLGDVQLLTGADLGYTLVGVIFAGNRTPISGMADLTFGLRMGVAW